jgi:peptidoglycan/LPS O-acetylase OafA/YrhL
MGTFRFFLAVSIVIGHAGAFFGVFLADARVAIQMFYLVSGFAMAFVWQGKYATARDPVRTFLANRALRLYPQYFIVLIGAILISIYAWRVANRHPIATAILFPLDWVGNLWIYLQQVILVGMESHLFLQRAADGSLAFCVNFHQGTQPPLHYYMFVPQAWMLSLQLVFYLLVPWLFSRPRLLVAVFALSFAARLVGWGCGLNADPWTHRFLPFEVGVFLLGALSYRLYAWLRERRPGWLARQSVAWGGLAGLVALILCLPLMKPALGELSFWVCYLAGVAVFPFLFHATLKRKADRWIGELSYPIYIAHLLVMSAGELFFGIPLNRLVYFAIPVTVVAAVGLNYAQERIDAFRHSLVKS